MQTTLEDKIMAAAKILHLLDLGFPTLDSPFIVHLHQASLEILAIQVLVALEDEKTSISMAALQSLLSVVPEMVLGASGVLQRIQCTPPVAAPVPQTNGRPPFMAQSSGNSRFSNPPPPRNRFQDQPRSHQAPGSISRAQEPRRVNPRQYDIVSDLNNLFRNAEYYDEEEPAFQLLNGHWLRGVTREAYDELLFEDQVTIRPHLRGRYLLSTGMSQDEVDVAVEMEMAGEDELDIEARINSMRAGEEW